MNANVSHVDALSVMRKARAAGIELWTEGQRLRYRAPAQALTADLRDLLRRHREDVVAALRQEAAQRIEYAPLAENQRGLWFLHQLVADSAAYNLAFSARIRGTLDIDLLAETLQILVDRHETLRSTYPAVDGQAQRKIAGRVDVELQRVDARAWTLQQLRDEVERHYAEPFDLNVGPLLRACLFEEASDRHILLLAVPHIAVDGTSLFLLLEDLFDVYTALVQGTSPPTSDSATFGEFVAWQASALARAEADRSYWSQVMNPPSPPLGLPVRRPRPQIPVMRGATVWRTLDARRTADLRALTRGQGTTDYVVLLALWFVLLYRLAGQHDIMVGTPVLGRPSARFARTIGDFVNTLPLRMRDLQTLTFGALIERVRGIVLEGVARQDFPLPRMLELRSHRSGDAARPFETLFMLQDFTRFASFERLMLAPEEECVNFGALTLSPFQIRQQEGQFELTLEVWPRGDELLYALRFDTELFDADTIRAWADAFGALAAAVTSEAALSAPLSELSLLDERQRLERVRALNETDRAYPRDRTVVDLFAEQVARRPAAIAVGAEGHALSYIELDARSDRLARHLQHLGVGPDLLVGLCVERGIEMAVGLLGILKAGGAYVPLDPGFPADRLRYMLEDCGARVLVTQSFLAASLFPDVDAAQVNLDRLDWDVPETQDSAAIALRPRAESRHRAYVIYTSGSTGRPKGVEIEHRALTNFLCSMAHEPGLSEDDVLLAVTTLSFDIAGLELFLPWIAGARVELADRETTLDPAKLARRIEDSSATVMQATPATWRMLFASGWRGRRGLKALCGGEAMDRDLAHRLLGACKELWNLYGPTETTIWSAVARIESADEVTIGRPIANTRIYVLDQQRNPVPPGVTGELWIGGDGVARGYINRAELTAERFVADPFHEGRMYWTGDLARYLPDGRFECLGRADDQVKVRGYRIELGEIESVLGEHERVAECAVVVRGAGSDLRLTAYVVGESDAQELRAHLRRRLPEYMVPAVYVPMDSLPRTPNKKIDRKALPEPEQSAREGSGFTSPGTPMELLMADLWRQLLKVEKISVQDNFFDLGGHSLLSVQFVRSLEKAAGVRIDPGNLIYQTLAQLAAACEQGAEADSQPAMAKRARIRDKESFYFGPADTPLFGSYHFPETDGPRQCGVVLSYPMGQEYMRSHRAFVQLATRLSRQGFPSLRFDYFGCGDSAGEHQQADIDRWLGDLDAAIGEMEKRSGVAGVCLVGMRLGATLAIMAGANRGDVERLALWNPVVDGNAHRAELIRLHEDLLRSSYARAPAKSSSDGRITELMGFPFGERLLEGIQNIDLLSIRSKPANEILLVDIVGDRNIDTLGRHLENLGARVFLRRVKGPTLWLEEPYKELMPVEVWNQMVSWLSAAVE